MSQLETWWKEYSIAAIQKSIWISYRRQMSSVGTVREESKQE